MLAVVPHLKTAVVHIFVQFPSCLQWEGNSRLCYSLMAKSRSLLQYNERFGIIVYYSVTAKAPE